MLTISWKPIIFEHRRTKKFSLIKKLNIAFYSEKFLNTASFNFKKNTRHFN